MLFPGLVISSLGGPLEDQVRRVKSKKKNIEFANSEELGSSTRSSTSLYETLSTTYISAFSSEK